MQLLYFFETLRTPFLDTLFGTITRLGEETVAIALICTIFWCVSKEIAYGVGVSFFVSGMAVQTLKVSYRVPRPWVLDPGFNAVESAIPSASGYSFPSGHTQTAGSLYGTLGLYSKKTWIKLVCIALVLLVGLSRMYLGVHTPADVVAGLAVSIVISVFVWSLFNKVYGNPKYDICVSGVIAVIAVAAIVYVFSISSLIDPGYIEDSCKTAGAALGFAVGYLIERRYINFDVKTEKAWQQAVKIVFGLAVAIGLKSGLKLILGGTALAGALRYFILVMWVLVIYPIIFKAAFKNKKA